MFYYRRLIQDQIEAEVETRQAVVLTGMRRVGKTTLMRQIYNSIPSQNKTFLDLGNPLHRKVLEAENYDAVWENLRVFEVFSNQKAYLFLDEMQNLPMASQVVKYLYDHYDVKFFITGSSGYYLKNLFPESLSGRKLVFEMFPLNFGEFLEFKNIKRITEEGWNEKAKNSNEVRYLQLLPSYLEYMKFGGFPEVVLEKSPGRKKQLLEDIFKSYFEVDVKTLSDFKELGKVRDLILLLAGRAASKLDIAKLASELGISRETVYSYLEFLERTYFVSLVTQFSQSIDRRVAGRKKVYLCDGGLANCLGQISSGQLFESSIFATLRPHFSLNYFSRGDGKEIDFIVNKKVALESKLAFSPQELSNLRLRAEAKGIKEAYLVVLKPFVKSRNDVIMATDL